MSFYSQVNRSHFVLFSESLFYIYIYTYIYNFFRLFWGFCFVLILFQKRIFFVVVFWVFWGFFVNLKWAESIQEKNNVNCFSFSGILRVAFLLKPIPRGKVKHSHFSEKKNKKTKHTKSVEDLELKKISFKTTDFLYL